VETKKVKGVKNISIVSFNKFRPYFSLFVLIGIIIIFSILRPRFFQMSNFLNILQQSATLIIAGMGMTFVIMGGNIDLSVGSIVGLSAVISTGFTQYGFLPSVGMGCLVGLAAGLLNGIVTVEGRIPSFIATLGSLSLFRGLTLIYTKGSTIIIRNDSFREFGRGTFFQIPYIILVSFVIFFITFLILRYTVFGRYTRAIGGNERVALLSGVLVNQVKIFIFCINGLFCGISGVVLAARCGAAVPTLGTGFELEAITAVVLGGTTLTGGVGSESGTLIGALVVSVLSNGLNIIGISTYYQMIIKGIVLVVAVVVSIDRSKIGIIK